MKNSYKIKPLFSIVTATYNSEKTLERTLKSIINQTYSNYEVIIVDGNSSDSTLEILSTYKNYIKILVSEEDEGIYDAFNKGVRLSHGEFVYFLNSDDNFKDKNVLKDVAEFYQVNHGNLDFIYANVEVVDSHGETLYLAGKESDVNDFKSGLTYPHQGFLASRKLFDLFGFFDQKLKIVADLDFMIKCFKNKDLKSAYFNRVLAEFNQGGMSTDYNNRQSVIREVEMVITSHFPDVEILNNDSIDVLYRKWFEINLLYSKGLSEEIVKKGYSNILLFGAMKTGQYFLKDCEKFTEEINVLCFVDNNPQLYKTQILGLDVHNPEWISDNYEMIDAIVITIEGNYEKEIQKQLSHILSSKPIPVISWKELLK